MRRLCQMVRLKNFLIKFVPPGANIHQIIDFFLTGSIISIIISLFFFVEYFNHYQNLFDTVGNDRVLLTDAIMPDFPLILGEVLIGFLITALCMLVFIAFYYAHYYQGGSKSIYLMKRLPHKFEIHKRALSLPIALFILSILFAFILALCYFAFYMLVTPKECLSPNQWQKFMSFFSYYF